MSLFKVNKACLVEEFRCIVADILGPESSRLAFYSTDGTVLSGRTVFCCLQSWPASISYVQPALL